MFTDDQTSLLIVVLPLFVVAMMMIRITQAKRNGEDDLEQGKRNIEYEKLKSQHKRDEQKLLEQGNGKEN